MIIIIKTVNDSNFTSEVLQNKKPVLVDFYAPWCNPCKLLAPSLDELSNEPIGNKTDFVKLNIDVSDEIPRIYGVMSVPTMIFFRDGEEQVRMVGVQPKDAIVNTICEYLI